MIVYKAHGDMTAPEPVECEKPGWPNRDVNGDEMFSNTHFATEAEAWESLFQQREAHLSLSALQLRDHQRHVADWTARTAEAGCLLAEAKEKHQEWAQRQKKGDTQ